MVLLHYCNFKGASKQVFFIGVFRGWVCLNLSVKVNSIRKSHLRVRSIVCPVQTDFQNLSVN